MNRSASAHPHGAAPPIGGQAGGAKPRRGVRVGTVAAAVIALVVLGYIGLWSLTVLQLRDGVLQWLVARQAEGYRVAYGTLAVSGFPQAARVTLGAPAIAAPDGRALSWSWAGEKAAIETNPLRPDALAWRLFGEQSVSINIDRKLRTYRGAAQEVMLQARGHAGSGPVSLSIRNLSLAGEDPGDVIGVDRLSASGQLAKHPPTGRPAAAYDLALQATGLRLPRQLDLPLGETIASLGAAAVVDGVLPAKADLPGVLAGWRAGGGAVELSQLSLRYGPLSLDGSGDVSLDAEMQPAGTFMARIQGFQQIVSALAERGIIDGATATKATIALAILSRPGADGGPPTLTVPLSLQQRTFSVGPLPLMVMPMIEWPRRLSPHTGELPTTTLAPHG